MARPKKYKIKLTDDELKEFKSVIRKNKTSKTIRCRCQIIIDLDESHGKVLTHEQSAKSNGVCLATVTNTVKKYFEGGIDAVTEFKRNVNSDNARRVLDGRAEARIIELACGPVPEGHSRWTIRLLEEKSKIVLDTPVSRTSEDRQQFHPREREDCGYVLTIGGTRIYIDGDGENTPEMKALHGIDIAFLPVNQPYTMTVDQAVDAVKAIRPAIFYPYHYGEVEEKTDIDRLSRELTDITEIRIRPME